MLLKFRGSNFKSFHEEFEFNMIPESRMTELRYSILEEQIGSRTLKALSGSAIYGPNAAGKTSIVNAMSCFRQIVLNGSIEDAGDDRTGDHVSSNMSLIPFRFAEREEPVSLGALFTHAGVLYEYELAFRVGRFLERGGSRRIERETLRVNGALVFDRTEDAVKELDVRPIRGALNAGYDMNDTHKHRAAMSGNLAPTSLLLTTDFNSFCSKRTVGAVRDWFGKQFVVVNSADKALFSPAVTLQENNALVEHHINEIAKEAGIVGSDFAYALDPDAHTLKLVSVLEKGETMLSVIDADRIESVGTMRLISIMPAVLSALRTGAVLVMDELDASLHPMITMNLISLFHDSEINVNRAQIIFDTHNPVYLNSKLLRRDEIKFVDRDRGTRASSLYALSDFGANGEASVRKTSDYMKNYFLGRYGAIEHTDFTDVIRDFISGGAGGETENG